VARPPTYQNFDNYLLPSLQAAYDFSADKSRIKAVLICNPHNPTSRCYTRKSLIECMEFCQERGLHFISDEINALIALNDTPRNSPKFVSALSLTEPLVPEGAVKIDPSRVHIVWAASKLFGCSGFRIASHPHPQRPSTNPPAGLPDLPAKPQTPLRRRPPNILAHQHPRVAVPLESPHLVATTHSHRTQLGAPHRVLPPPCGRPAAVGCHVRHAHGRHLCLCQAGEARAEHRRGARLLHSLGAAGHISWAGEHV
jgi:hypothetical protein